jgi:membrane-bound lytic murein transglycosylase D
VPFPRPASLEPNIHFWVDVFTAYSYRDFVVHDRTKVWKIYEVLHMPGSGPLTQEEVEWARDYLRIKYSRALSRLASGQKPTGYVEGRIAALFRNEPAQNYAIAADNLRVQQGMRERFRETLVRGHGYQPVMGRIFRAAGLPVELTLLPSVESGYYTKARSSAGAVGIWQFTRATGRRYMTIRGRRDERLDPMRETVAAAKLLRYNHTVLGNWPLAITAYNYGTYGMARASAIHGSDLGHIVTRYNGPHFGFASKNYYAEFLAALQVHQYEDKYFPGIKDEVAPIPPFALKTASAESAHRSTPRRHVNRALTRTRRSRRHRVQPAVLRDGDDSSAPARLDGSNRSRAQHTKPRSARASATGLKS